MLIVDLYILEFVPSSTFNLAELNLHTASKLSNPSCKIQGHTCQTKRILPKIWSQVRHCGALDRFNVCAAPTWPGERVACPTAYPRIAPRLADRDPNAPSLARAN